MTTKTLHAHIIEARNELNLQRYKAKRRADYFRLAGLPDHRTNAERTAYRAMMARRVRPGSTRYQRAFAAYLKRESGRALG